MARESLRVPLLMFRLRSSSQNLHKIAKNTSVCPEEDKYSDSNIFGRYVYHGSNMEEILMSRDTVIFLLQRLDFVLSVEKSILNPVQEIEFLGVTINSLKMCVSLPQEKMLKIQSQCQDVHGKGQVTVHELTKSLGLLASTIQAVLPAQVNVRYLQQQQIKALRATQCYQVTALLNSNSKEELQWWIQNLQIFNGRYLIQPQKALTIRTDASKKGWGAVCQGIPTGGE